MGQPHLIYQASDNILKMLVHYFAVLYISILFLSHLQKYEYRRRHHHATQEVCHIA